MQMFLNNKIIPKNNTKINRNFISFPHMHEFIINEQINEQRLIVFYLLYLQHKRTYSIIMCINKPDKNVTNKILFKIYHVNTKINV